MSFSVPKFWCKVGFTFLCSAALVVLSGNVYMELKALIASCRKIEVFCEHSHPSGTCCSLIISHRLLNKVDFTSP